jgi:exodeoxyribonuclease V alpha subunit
MTPSTTTTVTVSTVHQGPVGGAIFTGRDDSGKWIRAVAESRSIFRSPLRGEVWQLTGLFRKHPRYGDQLYVERAQLLRPTGHLLVRYLITHPSFRGTGIGMAYASRLYKEFGEKLALLLDEGDVDSLTKVIDEQTAQKLITAWQSNAQEASTVVFLDRYSVDTRLAGKILRYWPKDTVGKLKENPYRLLALTEWPIVDRLALSLGMIIDDERRLIAAAEAAVYRRLDTAKDTLIDDQSLRKNIKTLLRCQDDTTPRTALELAVKDNTLIGDAEIGYQAFGCMVMERYLMERFGALVNLRQRQLSLLDNATNKASFEALVLNFEKQESITLNAEQRAAVRMAATEPLSVLKGGAGVGKTTVLKAVHHFIEATGGHVVQMALSGRAAQRMREATGRDAYTIAGFLNKIRADKIKLGPDHLLIIDESSMLDLMLMYRIMRVLPKGVRLLLVGDPYQLPPIGPGLIFHVMAASPVIPVQELMQIHRQAESTGIPKVANQVRCGIIPALPRFNGLGVGVTFLECSSSLVINHLTDIVSDLGGFDDMQIIGVVKGGSSGVANINQTFHRKLTIAKRRLDRWDIAELDPVIYTVNDYDRELYNGSLGRVERVYAEPLKSQGAEAPIHIMCDFDGRKLGLSDSDMCNIELAYAITTHKSQGSQFKRVIIPIVQSRLLDRTLVYTALTRGVEQVIFVGDRRAFDGAIINAPSVTRRSIGFRI